ncbi:MAG TPA: mechanosensitive ion channel family protein [Clostridia bacterium]|nr:mechanosensitive ion channel family protein [Clostridia bacterium]
MLYNPALVKNVIGPIISDTSQKTLLRVLQGWHEDLIDFLRHDAPKILGALLVAFILSRLLKVISKRLVSYSNSQELPSGIRAQQLRTLASIIYSVGLFIIIFFAVLTVLGYLGINMGPLLASAGIAGLAVGFGAQTLVKDVINGFFILIENQYDIGDVVKITNVQGAVEALTLRRTVLRDADGTLHIIPNSEIKIVSNLTRDWTQLALHVTVDYKEDSDKVVRLLREVGAELRNDERFSASIVADPDVPGIEKVSASEVDYLMLVKTKPGQQYAISRELRRKIKECFQKHGIQPGGQNRFYVVSDTATKIVP